MSRIGQLEQRVADLARERDSFKHGFENQKRAIDLLQADLAAALSRAEKAEGERDRLREALEEIDRWGSIKRAVEIARAALSTGDPTPRVERGASRP